MAEQFKVGDIVVVTKAHNANYSQVGQIVRIIENNGSFTLYRVEDFNKLYNWMGEKSWCKGVRKPTYEELCFIKGEALYDIY